MWLFNLLFSSLSTLICRGTDISKCFSESLGIRDNESRLYMARGTSSRRKQTDPFLERRQHSFDRFASPESVSILHNKIDMNESAEHEIWSF